MQQKFQAAGPFVLGMHDALVSLTGTIGGLTFALANRQAIILSAIIASVAAGLSMGASCYLAEKTNANIFAARAGIVTGVAYIGTCVVLILPFLFLENTRTALVWSLVMGVGIIFGCNWCIGWRRKQNYWRGAIEMLVVCSGVCIISFLVGELAKFALG